MFLAAVVLREFDVVKFWLPENRRLVPEGVHRHGRSFGPLQFGFELGTGMRTYVPSGLPYVLALSVAFVASPVLALVAGIGFGCGRAMMALANLRFSTDNSWDLAWISAHRVIKIVLVLAFLIPFVIAIL
ncbi:hypothetical protein [Micromonospora deserti]|uniref:hypothetical protein n=1 Tax=Micromonospora deserti TaxID=2070366 RepID=UPI001F2E62E4|nr:hypothetical protein [Micromonospora deserti]